MVEFGTAVKGANLAPLENIWTAMMAAAERSKARNG